LATIGVIKQLESKMESVETCKKEIDTALKDLERITESTKVEFHIINAIEIIRIYTEVLIKHTRK
jgi:hypothetical protein